MWSGGHRRVLAAVRLAVLAAVMSGGVLLPSPTDSADHPNALWRVVHGLCLRDMQIIGRPNPCLAVDRQQG